MPGKMPAWKRVRWQDNDGTYNYYYELNTPLFALEVEQRFNGEWRGVIESLTVDKHTIHRSKSAAQKWCEDTAQKTMERSQIAAWCPPRKGKGQ